MTEGNSLESKPFRINYPQVLLVPALVFAVFLTSSFCMSLPRGPNGILILWFTNGIPLAALLRTNERRWPTLLAAALIGIISAALLDHESAARALLMPVSGVFQYGICAYILRRRLGFHFDLTKIDHLYWLFGLGFALTALQVIVLSPFNILTYTSSVAGNVLYLLSWFMTAFLGLFVLSLPLLALSASTDRPKLLLDRFAVVLLLLLATVVTLVFGPPAFIGAYAVLPVLMILAWRYGLLGAAVGNLLTVFLVSAFTYFGSGIGAMLQHAGYGISTRGHYLELFFCASLLISLPLAVARARQAALADELAATLTASEARALRLVESEAIAVKAREQLRRVIETSTDIICTLDAKGRVLEVSENCEAIWGWSRDAVLGHECYEFLVPDDRDRSIRAYDAMVEAGHLLPAFRNSYVRPDGTIVPMAWSATWIEEEQLCYCVGRDMTEHDALEAQVYAAQRMEAIGHLTGGIAHDFNNLLTVVIGNTETLATELDDPRHRRLAEMSLRVAKQGADLTWQLLAFARRQPLEPRAFDVNEMLDTSPLISRTLGEDLEVSIQKAADLWIVFADPLRTETAILNLCLNARDAMPSGGKLSIQTANAYLTEADVRGHPETKAGDYVMIKVSDEGIGIAPGFIDRIFDPFFTTKDVGKGSGLGLSMVYGFVKQSHGHLSVASEIGKGTSIAVFLPASHSDAESIAASGEGAEEIISGHESVLVVEDHVLVREQVQCQLESLGYQVAVASNAAEALTILEQRQDIALLFTDVVMPGNMTGRELGEHTAERWPHVRILYTSGYAQDALTQAGQLLKGVKLLSKPYTKEELSSAVRSVLDAMAVTDPRRVVRTAPTDAGM